MADGVYKDSRPSPALAIAAVCLCGQRNWRGRVRGLFGLIAREFSIVSESQMIDDALCFTETLRFDDGEIQKRSWRLFDGVEGVGIEGEGISQISPGRVVRGEFVVSYSIRFGAFVFKYRDRFMPLNCGATENVGVATLFGVPLLKIHCTGVLALEE